MSGKRLEATASPALNPAMGYLQRGVDRGRQRDCDWESSSEL